jgi:hypothetical protein
VPILREVGPHVSVRPLEPVNLKGIEGERTLYEVLGLS